MKTLHLLAFPVVAVLLCVPAMAALTLATSRGSLGSTASAEWSTVGDLSQWYYTPLWATTTDSDYVQVDALAGDQTAVREIQGLGGTAWEGNFAPGDHVLFTDSGPLKLRLDSARPARAMGFNIMSAFYGAFTAQIEAYTAGGTLLGSVSRSGTSSGANNGSAIFIGIRSDAPPTDFAYIIVRLTSAPSYPADFAINRVDFAPAPAPEVSTVAAARPVSASSAVFTGAVDANGYSTTVYMDYGSTPSVTSWMTATPSPVTGDSMTAVSAARSGLVPGQRIYYGFSASSAGGYREGPVQSYIHLGPGNQDYTFSSDGVQTTPFMDGATMRSSQGRDVAVQPDGKAVVAGFTHNGTNADFAVRRYLADGSLDAGFGTAGLVLTPVGTGDDFALGVALQPDGKIVVCGYFSNGTEDTTLCVVRLNTDGSLDNGAATDITPGDAFSGDGIFVAGLAPGPDVGMGVTLDAGGRIFVAGFSAPFLITDLEALLVCITPEGNPDTSFAPNGMLAFGFNTSSDVANDVAVDANGKIVVAGHANPAGSRAMALWRFNSNGTPDGTFGTGGRLTTAAGTVASEAYSVALTKEGGIIAAGWAYDGTSDDFAVVRYTPTGGVEPTFAAGGIMRTPFGNANDVALDVVVQPDGRIVAAGFSGNGTHDDMAVLRLNPDGSPDATFDGDGKVTLNPGPLWERLYGIALAPDGDIMASGYSDHAGGAGQFALVRLIGGPNDLLVNGGFESNEALGRGIATIFGDWKQDIASTVGPENGITPWEGVRMVRLDGTTDSGGQAGNLDGDVSQFVDLRPYAAALAAGQLRVTATARVNRVAGNASTDTMFRLLLIGYDGPDIPGRTWVDSASTELISDNNPATWEPLTLTWTPPPATKFLFVNPYAKENVVDDASGEFAGHYVDGVTLTLAPEIAVHLGSSTNDPELTDGQSVVVDFGITLPGATVVRAFSVTNTGIGALETTGLNLPGGFTLAPGGPALPSSVGAGQTATWQVRLGTLSGTFRGNLQFVSNDEDEAVFDIPVTGFVGSPPNVTDTEWFTLEDMDSSHSFLNASDLDGNPLSWEIVSPPVHGILLGVPPPGFFSLAPRAVVYRPDLDFHGTDSFTFRVYDGTYYSGVATVVITVLPVNDPPVADSQAVSTSEDMPLAVTLTATDVDSTALAYSILTPPSHGMVSGTGPDFTYTPEANYHGPDSFSFKASDGEEHQPDSAPAMVTITVTSVNDAPDTAFDVFSVNEDQTLTVTSTQGVLKNDSDLHDSAPAENNHPLTASVEFLPPHAASFTLNPNGTFTYTPKPDFHGLDGFTYRAVDALGAQSEPETVLIAVWAVNDAPVAASQELTTLEDVPIPVRLRSADVDLLITFDPNQWLGISPPNHGPAPHDADPLYSIVTAPQHGTLSGDGPDLIYTPNADYHGADSFTFTADDGLAVSNVATVTITIQPDSDGDELPDLWEMGAFGNLTFDDDDDPDGDGQDNAFELTSGHDPNNGADYLSLEPASPSRTGGVFRLNYVRPGVRYRLESSTDLEAWDTLVEATYEIEGPAAIYDLRTEPAWRRFYRVSVRPE